MAMKHRSVFFKFFPPPQFLAMSAVGVAISDRSIRYAELVQKGAFLEVRRYGEKDIPQGVVSLGKIEDPETLKNLLKEFRKKENIRFVRFALQEQQGYLVQLEMPKTKKADIRGNIELQLEENVPIPPREAVFDYKEAACSASEHSHGMRMGVSVMPKDVVQSYVNLFHEAELTPLSFEIEAQALVRALVAPDDCGTYMIADIGSTRTGLSIVSAGIVRFTWTIPIGGDLLTRAVAKIYNLNIEDARKKKEKEGFKRGKMIDGKQDMAEALSLQMRVLREEIKKREVYWHTHFDGGQEREKIQKLILCGGEANVPGLSEYLAAGLSVPVILGNPWKNIADSKEYVPPISFNHSLRYTAALGLALRVSS